MSAERDEQIAKRRRLNEGTSTPSSSLVAAPPTGLGIGLSPVAGPSSSSGYLTHPRPTSGGSGGRGDASVSPITRSPLSLAEIVTTDLPVKQRNSSPAESVVSSVLPSPAGRSSIADLIHPDNAERRGKEREGKEKESESRHVRHHSHGRDRDRDRGKGQSVERLPSITPTLTPAPLVLNSPSRSPRQAKTTPRFSPNLIKPSPTAPSNGRFPPTSAATSSSPRTNRHTQPPLPLPPPPPRPPSGQNQSHHQSHVQSTHAHHSRRASSSTCGPERPPVHSHDSGGTFSPPGLTTDVGAGDRFAQVPPPLPRIAHELWAQPQPPSHQQMRSKRASIPASFTRPPSQPQHHAHRASISSAAPSSSAPGPDSSPGPWFAPGPAPLRDFAGWSNARLEGYRMGYEDAMYALQRGTIGVGSSSYIRPAQVRQDDALRSSLVIELSRRDEPPTTIVTGPVAPPPWPVQIAGPPPLLSHTPRSSHQPSMPSVYLPAHPGSHGHHPHPHQYAHEYPVVYGPPIVYPPGASPTMVSMPGMPPQLAIQMPVPSAPSGPILVAGPHAGPGPPGPSGPSGAASDPNYPSSPLSPLDRPNRQLISCFPCRKRKLKCDGHQPCGACVKRSSETECRYEAYVRRRGKGKKQVKPGTEGEGDDGDGKGEGEGEGEEVVPREWRSDASFSEERDELDDDRDRSGARSARPRSDRIFEDSPSRQGPSRRSRSPSSAIPAPTSQYNAVVSA